MDILIDLSTREKQVYGALCLHRFCKAKNIEHECVDELIAHLLLVLVNKKLAGWEDKGADLELCGRGEPLPKALEAQLSEDIREDFARLVDYVVKIGIDDMYGASTMKPLNNVLRCLEILDAHGVERPDINELFKDRTPREEDVEPYWGETFSQGDYERVKSLFN